jgi:uncharacterized protein (TIGR03437 family)
MFLLVMALLSLFMSLGLHAATCVPSQLVIVFTNAPNTLTVDFPIALGLRVVDDCGNYVSQGSAVATFSNGDVPIALTFSPVGNGLFVGTFVVAHPSSKLTIKIYASTTSPLGALVGSASTSITVIQAPSFAVTGTDEIPQAVAGGEPVRQKATITSPDGQVPFQVTAAIVGGRTDAFSVEPSIGVTPATVDLVFAPPVDVPGNTEIQAVLQFNSNYLTLPFPLTVGAPPSPALSISKDHLLFSYLGSQAPRSQLLTVGNVSGLTLSFSVATVTSSGGRWLSANIGSGVTTLRQPASLSITANPAGLRAGTYSGIVRVAASDGTLKNVPVTMTVTDAQPSILLSQLGLTFNAIQNGSTEPAQTFSILNGGEGTLNWRASARNQPSWLKVSPAAGRSIAESENNPQVTVTADGANLAAGRYYALIQVDSDGTDNSPQYLTVVLSVSPNTGQAVIFVSPSGVIATAQVGKSSVVLPSFYVYDLGGHPVSFTSAAATFDSGNWLFYNPSQVSNGSPPVRIDPLADSRSLVTGVHRGAITLQFADGSTRVVSVLLQLTPPQHRLRPGGPRAPSHADQTQPEAESDCVAKTVTIQYTATGGYQVVAGWPATFMIQAFDNCNQPFNSGSIDASFSTGEPPISLQHVGNGNWSQTWTPRASTAASVRVSFHAADPARGLDAVLPYPVDMPITTYDPPILEDSGIIDPVSALKGLPLGPGSQFVASGQRLASSTISVPAPYPLALGDTSVIAGSHQIPLSSAGSDSLSGILPFDIPVNTSIPLIVFRGNTLSTPVLLTVATAAPSVYSQDGTGTGQGLVYHDASPAVLADSANPALVGELLTIECAGLGAVAPAESAGIAATSRLSVVADVNVTVGAIPAAVTSAQLKIGAVGVYVVQITVPTGLTAGDSVPVQISIAERVSNQVTIAVH